MTNAANSGVGAMLTWIDIVMKAVDIIGLLLIPVIAVYVGQYLQNRSDKRKDKLAIFQCLMTHRIVGWTNRETVDALNSIDIVFADDEEVRKCWADLLAKLNSGNLSQDVSIARCKLLESMAEALGYGKKITWSTIQNPYCPIDLLNRMKNETLYENGQLAAARVIQLLEQRQNQNDTTTQDASQVNTGD